MALSPNYGWSEPDNSSLVKNGAADIRTLGDAIDTSVWNVGFGQAGKNKIINGDFKINQRNFTSTTTAGYSIFDRWLFFNLGGTQTVSTQAFTPGAAPVSGYEGSTYCRNVTSGFTYASTDYAYLSQRIEDVRVYAGQTATLSFWAKSASGTPKVGIQIQQNFGTGGSPSTAVNTYATPVTISSTWTRYSATITMPSISGKTIGTDVNSSHLRVYLWFEAGTNNSSVGITAAQNNTFDIWGVQIEYGSKASPFQTASGGSPQQELAMCQRYYTREKVTNNYCYLKGFGNATTTTLARIIVPFPVEMRVKPTSMDKGASLAVSDGANLYSTGTFVLSTNCTTQSAQVEYTHGSAVFTQFRYYGLQDENTGATYLGFSAEL